MEYVEGRPLRGPVSLDAARQYSLQIADALDAAYPQGVVHRDLKPENILLTLSGIFELNKDQLTDPDKIKPEQVLHLP